jgi:hypothetical protein
MHELALVTREPPDKTGETDRLQTVTEKLPHVRGAPLRKALIHCCVIFQFLTAMNRRDMTAVFSGVVHMYFDTCY